MSELTVHQVDRNLQTILDRYSLVGADSDPAAMDISNFSRYYSESLRARKNRLYGELTSRGIAFVWADFRKTENSSADVLVIEPGAIVTAHHIYNRRSGMYDWHEHDGTYTSIPLEAKANTLVTVAHDKILPNKHAPRYKQVHAAYMRTIAILAKITAATDENDALHQAVALRNPLVPVNLEQLYPYAGHTYGPRVNLQEMIDADVQFHPAVAEALRLVPEMTIDS